MAAKGELSLTDLIEDLKVAFKEGCSLTNNPERVKALLERCTTDKSEFDKFALFDASKLYTRNLIFSDERFALILLCWNPSKSSPVHDHAGSACWFRVVSGEVGETRYRVENGCDLVQTSECIAKEGLVGYITDEAGVHRVFNPTSDTPAMSLHCYAPAIEVCKMFRNGKALEARTCYYSEYGNRIDYSQQS